jgi:hypothetical protein
LTKVASEPIRRAVAPAQPFRPGGRRTAADPARRTHGRHAPERISEEVRMKLEGSCHCGAVRFAVEAPHPYPFNLC